jgi:hypothetical protein
MLAATQPFNAPSTVSASPRRSPRTSLILAELARQRRWERRQRRKIRARRSRWLALFDRRPFESIRAHSEPALIFGATMPLVYARHGNWRDAFGLAA